VSGCGGADRRAGGEVGHGERHVQLFLSPGQYGGQGLVREVGHRSFHELPLPAVPVPREDQPPAHGVGDLDSVIEAHVHDDTDEFFLVLDGQLHIALREPTGEREVVLPEGAVFTVARGIEHKPSAPSGAAILMFEPTGTLTVGDRHEGVPDHIDVTTGHALGT
jgi:mannose-6-phosphate isomerase-like protein (cupin superfamily)